MGNATFESKGINSENERPPGPPPMEGDSGARLIAAVKGGVRESLAWARRSVAREFWDWAQRKQATVPSVNRLTESLAALQTPSLDAANRERDIEEPIFLLATGWRTGSTLLQRILVTDPKVLLWGEPFGELALPSRIAEMVSQLPDFVQLKERTIHDNATSSTMATSWIATLYPPGEDFRSALRCLFERWLGDPARHRGFARWGFKDVRLGATEAQLLHWLYPKAKFVILSRHPYDCYRSLADSRWHHVYYRRPDVRVDSAAGFARHWNRLALSWSELPNGFPAIHVKYEDLVGGRVDFRKLESWLGIAVREDVALSVAVGHTAVRPRLSWHERFIIAREAGPGMRALGYSK